MSDDAALFDEPDETEKDTTAEQRNEQVLSNANKKKLVDVEEAKFEEVKNVPGTSQHGANPPSAPSSTLIPPEAKVSQPTKDPY